MAIYFSQRHVPPPHRSRRSVLHQGQGFETKPEQSTQREPLQDLWRRALRRQPDLLQGYKIKRDRPGRRIKLTFPQKIFEAVREHLPDLLEQPVKLPTGRALHSMADALKLGNDRPHKLAKHQVRTQQLVGSLKYIELIHPRIALLMHRLSCVMSNPPEAAYTVALAALAMVYNERDVGITYGGIGLSTGAWLSGFISANINLSLPVPAPAALEALADASWGNRNLIGIILTYGGAAVLIQVKKAQLVCISTIEVEAVATSKAAEKVVFAREIARSLGVHIDGPTLMAPTTPPIIPLALAWAARRAVSTSSSSTRAWCS